MRRSGDTAARRPGDWWQVWLAGILLSLVSASAVWFFYERGCLLYYGDAEAHLNIARRIVDSRTPGPDQLGTVWLPLPHLLLVPFVSRDALWRSGLAGAIPGAVCFVIAGAFLFAAARRIFGGAAAGAAAAALFALNPNILYLQSTPMTEVPFAAALAGLLYFSVLFRETQSLWAAAGAGLAACAGALTRYEGWFLIPFATLYFLIAARRRRWLAAFLFGALAAAGPLAWLAHNRYYFGDALYFYTSPYSPQAIQGKASYPGNGNWPEAAIYFQAAVTWCAGPLLRWLAVAGVLVMIVRKAWWPLLLLALPGFFYVWSMHSSGTPIFVPDLWPHSYYNTRYGLAVFPLAVLAAAALVMPFPARRRGWMALAVVVLAALPWLIHPGPERWITWKESQVNSAARRAWTRRAAGFLAARYHRGEGIFTSFGDMTGILRMAGLPLRETLTGDNGPLWMGAAARPDLFLWEEWAICQGGDTVQTAINRARRRGPNYDLVDTIIVKGAPVLEIYHRSVEPDVEPQMETKELTADERR